tara:strand:+ start:1381 stop:1602 length:222 start_codon:yes stop_codon:yes gene_type:complete
MSVPTFETKKEILDYSVNGSDPWIIIMVRHCIERDGASLNTGTVNNYIKKEIKSLTEGYDTWYNEEIVKEMLK